MNKVILIDSSGLAFPCIFSHERQLIQKIETNSDIFIMPSHVIYFYSIISALKKIGVDENTKIIIALEGKSWRKNLLSTYKSQRADDRAKHELINWEEEFRRLNKLHEDLEMATDWHFIREWESECDDIIAVSCRFFKDNEVIVVTGDKDLHQLAHYSWVKIFNVNKKAKGTKGCYEFISNPLKIIADKAKRGDVSDNILVSEDDEEEDFNLRFQLVNLLELPDYIENSIKEILEHLSEKQLNLQYLPKFSNCKERFLQIYNKEYKITPEYCYSLIEKRKNRKLKKDKIKREEKKKEKENNAI